MHSEDVTPRRTRAPHVDGGGAVGVLVCRDASSCAGVRAAPWSCMIPHNMRHDSPLIVG